MGSRSPIKLAVLGDSGVGKTSLIVALSDESFPENCPPVLPPTIMPANYLPDGMPFEVIDTCTRPEERAVLEQICLSADAIILLFASASLQSLKRIETHWLPELRRIGVKTPIILVASKTDLSHQSGEEIKSSVRPYMEKFKEIESCVQCSAKLLKGISDVFEYGVKTVINPLAPVFNARAENGQGALTPLCIRALRRIFVINDKDKDGALNDAELNNFQMAVFSGPLQPEELVGLHQMVAHEMPQGVSVNGLTLPGFWFLHAVFIEKGSLDTVWAVLRRYGYNNDVLLDQEVLSEVNFTHSPEQVVEMTDACENFLSEKFVDFDNDGSKLLDSQKLNLMWATAPHSPWRDEEFNALMVEVGKSGNDSEALTLQGFLAKWAYMTFFNPVLSLAYIRYLGYEGPAGPMFNISKTRKQERNIQQLQRKVVLGFVILGNCAGRGTLLKVVSGRDLDSDSSSKFAAAGEVIYDGNASGGGTKTIILQEVEAEAIPRLKQEQKGLESADFVLLTFSGNDVESVREAERSMMEIAKATEDTMPCILVNFQEKGNEPSQEVIEEYGKLIARLDLRQPAEIAKGSVSDVQSLLKLILNVSEAPERCKAIPQTPALRARKEYQRTLRRSLFVLGGSIFVGAACYVVYKSFRKPDSHSDPQLQNGHEIDASQTQRVTSSKQS